MKKNYKAKNFDGALSKVPEMRNWVTEQMEEHEISEEIIYDIKVALSEALSNVFRHAYVNEMVKPIRIKILIEDDAVQISLRDFGKKFDINGYESPDLAKASTGGYGIYMIKQLMDGVQYVPHKIGAELILWKKRGN